MTLGRNIRFTFLALAAFISGIHLAGAVCDAPLQGFPIFQCADFAYFDQTTDTGKTVPISIDPNGRPSNVSVAFWQIGFGNRLINSGYGTSGTGNQNLNTFNGNDNGLAPVGLKGGKSVNSMFPVGSVCLTGNNWANSGIDGCCDNVRSATMPQTSDDDILNPYYNVYYARAASYPGYYSLDWQQDYPIAVLLTESTGKFFAFAAVATLDRANDGSGGNGPCFPGGGGTNPAPCDTRVGFYEFKAVNNGRMNPITTLPNVVPWQEVPVPSINATPVDPNDPNSPETLDMSWPAALLYSDETIRPSTNPSMGSGSGFADGVGVNDIGDPNAPAFPLIRYRIEVAADTDTTFSSPTQTLECSSGFPADSDPNCTSATSASLVVPGGQCVRLKTLFGKKPQTATTSIANCRVGKCGDLGYEVNSTRTCVNADTDGDGFKDSVDNCPLVYNISQADGESDGVGDACDLCPMASDPPVCVGGTTPGDACAHVGIQDTCDGGGICMQSDTDADGAGNACDNCPSTYNNTQADGDADGRGDVCDNCATTYNPSQSDGDFDRVGDACDNCLTTYNPDNTAQVDTNGDMMITPADCVVPFNRPSMQCEFDFDGFGDICDNCPVTYNPSQQNSGGTPAGDACEPCIAGDPDLDNICNDPIIPSDPTTFGNDNCPNDYNPSQADLDSDHIGDVCDLDDDNDSHVDVADPNNPVVCKPVIDPNMGQLVPTNCFDNCPRDSNPFQEDADLDGAGDACDVCRLLYTPSQLDTDGDRVGDVCENCPTVYNPSQQDSDADGFGNACDNCPGVVNPVQSDSDNDGPGDSCDNCPFTYNPSQSDADGDGFGDACDTCMLNDVDNDRVCDDVDNCLGFYNPSLACVGGMNPGTPCNDYDDLQGICNGGTCRQLDSDGDGLGDFCDNCDLVMNAPYCHGGFGNGMTCRRLNSTMECGGMGALCRQDDDDGDSVGNECDNCLEFPNPGTCSGGPTPGTACMDVGLESNCGSGGICLQTDTDNDGEGDACDLTIVSPIGGDVLDCRPITYNNQLEAFCVGGDQDGSACTRPGTIRGCEGISTFVDDPNSADPNDMIEIPGIDGQCVRTGPPTFEWSQNTYDLYRFYLSWDANFTKRNTINSGKHLLGRQFWAPTRKQWRRACNNANPSLFLKMMGLDKNAAKGSPSRRTVSAPVQVDVAK